MVIKLNLRNAFEQAGVFDTPLEAIEDLKYLSNKEKRSYVLIQSGDEYYPIPKDIWDNSLVAAKALYCDPPTIKHLWYLANDMPVFLSRKDAYDYKKFYNVSFSPKKISLKKTNNYSEHIYVSHSGPFWDKFSPSDVVYIGKQPPLTKEIYNLKFFFN